MKNKSVIIAFILIILITMTGCNNKQNNKKEVNNSTSGNVTMTIKEDSLTEEGLIIILKNNTSNDYFYYPEFFIEKYENESYTEIDPKKEMVWAAVIYTIKGNNSIELETNWKDMYGNLSKGKYRVVKKIMLITNDNNKDNDIKPENVYVEFEIK